MGDQSAAAGGALALDRPQPRPAGHATVGEESQGRPASVEQVASLLEAALAAELRFGLFLRMVVILGARLGELCVLRWPHVDFEHGEIVIERGIVDVPGQPLIEQDTRPTASGASPACRS